MNKLSTVAAAAAVIAGASAQPEPVAAPVEPAPPKKLTREEFEASMKLLLDQQQVADHLEGWFRHALTYLVLDHKVPQAEAEPLAMKLAEQSCTVREWEFWPLPDEVVAKHMRAHSP